MRAWLFSIVVLALSPTLGWGQSGYFLPFEQTKGEVISYLTKQAMVPSGAIQQKADMGTIVAILDENHQVEYAFQNNRLYATTVIRNYPNSVHGLRRQQECLKYMKESGTSDIQEKKFDNEQITCYTSVTETRVFKLFVRRHQGSVTLTFSSIQSKYFDSRSGANKYFYEAELLDQRVATREQGKP